MASMKTDSNVGERYVPSGPPSHAQSQGSLANPHFSPYQEQQSHYPVPQAVRGRSPFARRKYDKGRGRAYIALGMVQVIVGIICFVLALIGLSVATSGSSYSPGLVSGICFVTAGIFGCLVGTSDNDCYSMTYFILNFACIVTALVAIGLSGWEIHGMGVVSRVLTSQGFYTIKCAIVIIGCIIVLLVSIYQAYQLRGTPCCKLGKRKQSTSNVASRGYVGPLDCVAPVSNTTTNSSWHWNMQHAVNQSGQPANYPPQDPNVHQQYLERAEKPAPLPAYSYQDSPRFAGNQGLSTQVVPSTYDPARDADVHIQPAYI